MEKEAMSTAAKAILGTLGTLGVAGGSGYLGHQLGYKGGATRATNEMASAFSEANERENQQIVDSFKLFNKKENAALASNYMRRGMALGAQLHASGKIKTSSEMNNMKKTSSFKGDEMNKEAILGDIYNAAFESEIDKLAAAGLISKGISTLSKSFKNLGGGIKKQYGHVKKQITQPGKRKMSLKTRMGHMGKSALTTAKGSRAALATTGVAAAGVGGAALS